MCIRDRCGTHQLHIIFDYSTDFSTKLNIPSGMVVKCSVHFIISIHQIAQRLLPETGTLFRSASSANRGLQTTWEMLSYKLHQPNYGMKLYVAGCEVDDPFEWVLFSTSESSHLLQPTFWCNAPEADTRIWLHAMHSVNSLGLNTLITVSYTHLTLPTIYSV